MLKIKKNNVLIGFVAIAFFSLYIALYTSISDGNFEGDIKYSLSLVGIIIYILCIYSWYRKTNKIIDLYTVFITLFFLFNFGECFLWAFNIHTESEIGYGKTFGVYIGEKSIILAQLFTLICLVLFHCGAMLSISNSNFINKKKKENTDTEEKFKKNMRLFCSLLLLVVVPITYYVQYKKMIISTKYGYLYLFNGEFSFGYISMISRLFFPCIYGLLFATDFKKNVVRICYILIGINFIMLLIIGARGSIVYELLILFFLHNRYVKKITFRNIIIYMIGFFIIMSIFSAVRTVRDYGVDFDKILNSISTNNNNIICESVFEMGSSMGIQCILIQNGFNIYPYGNTYLLGLLGIISEKVILMFNSEYIDLNTWFSYNYLKLDYGAGFTMAGEVILNFGPYIGPIVMLFWGYIITKITEISDNELCKKSIFSLITFDSFVMFIRGTFGYYIKYWFFVIIVFYGIFFIFNLLMNSKRKVKING